jgi:hypothetical protein
MKTQTKNSQFLKITESKIFKGLKNYFDNTSKEILEKDWEQIKPYNEIGPDVIETLQNKEN